MTEGLPWEMCLSYVSGAWRNFGPRKPELAAAWAPPPSPEKAPRSFRTPEPGMVQGWFTQPKSHSRTPLKCWIWQCFAIRMFWISLVSEFFFVWSIAITYHDKSWVFHEVGRWVSSFHNWYKTKMSCHLWTVFFSFSWAFLPKDLWLAAPSAWLNPVTRSPCFREIAFLSVSGSFLYNARKVIPVWAIWVFFSLRAFELRIPPAACSQWNIGMSWSWTISKG